MKLTEELIEGAGFTFIDQKNYYIDKWGLLIYQDQMRKVTTLEDLIRIQTGTAFRKGYDKGVKDMRSVSNDGDYNPHVNSY